MKSLQECRAEIDRLDAELLKLLTERMQVAECVARYKLANGIEVFDEKRERAVLDKIGEEAPAEIRDEIVGTWDGIMNMSKLRQYIVKSELSGDTEPFGEPDSPEPGRIGVQGVPGSFSSKAARELFPGGEPSFSHTFPELFDALEEGKIDCAIVPLENSIHGTVTEVYAQLLAHECSIVRVHPVGISHCLLANPGTRKEDIESVLSHEQALGQCAGYIRKNGWRPVSAVNTATAAKLVRDTETKTQAAIASEECAKLYGLEVLESGIQDTKLNLTRFAVVKRGRVIADRANKVSISFRLAHREGTLSRVLDYFAALGLNLTKIESSPIPEHPFEYRFYLDFVGSLADRATSDLIRSLSREMTGFRLLGNYCED